MMLPIIAAQAPPPDMMPGTAPIGAFPSGPLTPGAQPSETPLIPQGDSADTPDASSSSLPSGIGIIPESLPGQANTVAACIESWNCTEWTACNEGKSSRACRDANNCNTYKSRPAEALACESVMPNSIVNTANQPENTEASEQVGAGKETQKEISFTISLSTVIIFLAIIIAIFIFIVLAVFHMKGRKQAHSLPAGTYGYSETDYNTIEGYIIKNLRLGYSKERITEALVRAGHNPEKISRIADNIERTKML